MEKEGQEQEMEDGPTFASQCKIHAKRALIACLSITALAILYFGGFGIGTLLIQDDKNNMAVRWVGKPLVGASIILGCLSWCALVLPLFMSGFIMCGVVFALCDKHDGYSEV